MSKTKSGRATAAETRSSAAEQRKKKEQQAHAWRETIESIVVAVILAFLFRTFVAEAFVIPTGSMAPTLQGRHKDVVCEQCGHSYRTGASIENTDSFQGWVIASKCPICRHTMELDEEQVANQASFNGDRILVSKFDNDFHDPKRWDVIVFKYPRVAKQNYIKRLIGLPGETIRIRDGDIYVSSQGQEFRIAQKPDHKLRAMLQLVDDTDYIAEDLIKVGWPSRWQPWSPGTGSTENLRLCGDDQQPILLRGSGEPAWLRYRHLVPSDDDWAEIQDGQLPTDVMQRPGALISDFYAYNAYVPDNRILGHVSGQSGMYWVGDLGLQAELKIDGESGILLLDLVEGGVHYECRIDVATGLASFSIDAGATHFPQEDNREVPHPTCETPVRGPGKYELLFTNVDNELRLWVNGKQMTFSAGTSYRRPTFLRPQSSATDPGDAAPAGIGAEGVDLTIQRLRMHRDVYYIAQPGKYASYELEERMREIASDFASPDSWPTSEYLSDETSLRDFELLDLEDDMQDQFFPLGDNSPASSDARFAEFDNHRHYVERKLLTGKALLIYWPHSWEWPPFWPNWRRMGLIR